MKNTDLLTRRIEEAIAFLSKQDEKLLPIYEALADSIKGEELMSIPLPKRIEMYIKLQEQYTNSVLLLSKLKEILEYTDYS